MFFDNSENLGMKQAEGNVQRGSTEERKEKVFPSKKREMSSKKGVKRKYGGD